VSQTYSRQEKSVKTTFTTQGTCARSIEIEIDFEKIKEVKFVGGCSGNTTGLSMLLKGMPVEDVISQLKGIACRGETSCPDQLANALEAMLLKKAS
jgi:uncharacterized protein (TIGR03905 family)